MVKVFMVLVLLLQKVFYFYAVTELLSKIVRCNGESRFIPKRLSLFEVVM